MKILDKKDLNNKISLSDAKIVVSAGRGLKSSENWEMIEKFADLLGAATACSKPVSDLGWRPHGEHVGKLVSLYRQTYILQLVFLEQFSILLVLIHQK